METSDKKLIQEFLRGKEEAFSVLVNRYLKMTYNFLFQITKDKSVIDDLTQVTFLKVWKNLKKFDQEKKFKTWLFTIAKNTAFDHFKKKKTIPFAVFTDTEGNNKLEKISEDKILPNELLAQKDLEKNLENKKIR